MITLFQRKKTGKLWSWTIAVDGPKVVTTYGELGGKQQMVTETATAKNVGRSNEITPDEQAVLIAERHIKSKRDNGYVDDVDQAKVCDTSLDYDDPPVTFCPSKPVNSITDEKVRELLESGRLYVQRKFDGMCMLIFRGTDGMKILTRGKLEDKTESLPHLSRSLSLLPPGTILTAEAIAPHWQDNFRYVSSVIRTSDPKKAIAKQDKDGALKLVVFDVLHWGGEDITQVEYRNRIRTFEAWRTNHRRHAMGIEVPLNLAEDRDYDQLFGEQAMAVLQNWEGYVLWDLQGTTRIRYDGKEDRRCSYKWKPVLTEDIWAMEPYSGTDPDVMAGVHMYQYHNGEFTFVGKCGGGFSKDERREFWANRKKMFPCAMEIETPERLASMKLRFPQFVRLRPDKGQADCTVQLKPRS